MKWSPMRASIRAPARAGRLWDRRSSPNAAPALCVMPCISPPSWPLAAHRSGVPAMSGCWPVAAPRRRPTPSWPGRSCASSTTSCARARPTIPPYSTRRCRQRRVDSPLCTLFGRRSFCNDSAQLSMTLVVGFGNVQPPAAFTGHGGFALAQARCLMHPQRLTLLGQLVVALLLEVPPAAAADAADREDEQTCALLCHDGEKRQRERPHG